MKKNILYLAALAMLAVACNEKVNDLTENTNEPVVPEVKMITETITAINGDNSASTRADISDTDGAFTWSDGDQIAVHVSDGKYYTTDALADEADGSEEVDFTVNYPDGESRDAFAVFPANLVTESATNYGQSGATLDVTLPASYTLDEVSGTKTPCPMIADNSGDSWDFYQLCGMLRLTVNDIPADATGMVIQFPDKKVNGTFSIASPEPGTSTIATDTPAAGEDKITITFDAGITSATVNIPLPTGDDKYEYVYVTSVGGTTKKAAFQEIKAGGYTAKRARAKKLTTTMALLPVVTRSDGGDEVEPAVFTDELWYNFYSYNDNPIEVTINGNCDNVRFYLNNDPAIVTLTGSGDPVSATWSGNSAFIESENDLTVILDCNYVINCSGYNKAIECSETSDESGGKLKLKTTGGTKTLTVITDDDGTFAYGIYGDGNFNAWSYEFDKIGNLAVDGFSVSCPGPVSNGDGTYTWVYTVAPEDPSYKIKFTNNSTELTNVRFVRIFSSQNKLHNGETTYGPFTMSSDTNLPSPITADLTFDANDGDQIVFQVVDANGNVYSGCSNPLSKNATVEVTRYTFTVASGKKICFSPGDLGVDNDAYSFTEPFETWGWKNNSATKRVWFNYDEVHYNEVTTGHEIYGIKWRNIKSTSTNQNSTKPREWDYIIETRPMNGNVAHYYRVTIPDHGCCLLLPPDETVEGDLDGLIEGATITNYVKYLAIGFVLLISTGRATVSSGSLSWGSDSQGFYWNYRAHQTQARFFITWSSTNDPQATTSSSQHRMRVRYVHDVE